MTRKLERQEYTEADFEMEYWNSLSEEQKEEYGRKAKALFNSDSSPLAFMVQSAGSIGPSKLTSRGSRQDG